MRETFIDSPRQQNIYVDYYRLTAFRLGIGIGGFWGHRVQSEMVAIPIWG